MAKIQGIYTLRAPLFTGGDPSSTDLLTYSNNDRNAEILFSANCDLAFEQIDPENPANLGDGRCFLTNNILYIKRARIVTPGSLNIGPALGRLAAKLLLSVYAFDADNNRQQPGDAWQLKLDNYNEWVDLNLKFICYENLKSISDHYYFTILGQASSYMTVDDFNLQSAYENQPLRAFLELVVDTAGTLSTTDFHLV